MHFFGAGFKIIGPPAISYSISACIDHFDRKYYFRKICTHENIVLS